MSFHPRRSKEPSFPAMQQRDKLKPILFSIIKHSSKEELKEQIPKDIVAGVVVAVVALPLSIALGIASGVSPEQGLYTAIVAGFLIAFLGGSRVQISGPTAAFATIVAGIVATDGMEGLIAATIIAGIMLIFMGLFKLGALIRFVPFTITTGFTAGIAVTLTIGQLKDFFGLTYPPGTATVETTEKLAALAGNLSTVNGQACLVGVVCLAVLFLWPRVTERVPSSLMALLAGIALVSGLGLDVSTIGDLYVIDSALPTFHMPHFSLELFRDQFANGVTIAILAAIESLLSCVVADSMISGHHRANMELVAQGVGNIASVLFGGIPATGAIARTAANVKAGGRTPIAGMVHALVLIAVLAFLMPYAALIPMPTIAAILLYVAYGMSGWRNFAHLCQTASKGAVATLVLTFVLTIVFDLVVAIGVGMLITVVLFMKMVSEETEVKGWKYYCDENSEVTHLRELPKSVRVYEINGPMFFGMTERIADISVKDFTRYLIIRMRGVPSLDATGMNALENLYDYCSANGVSLIFSHVNEQPMKTMRRAGFVDLVGEEHFRSCIDDAIAHARELLVAEEDTENLMKTRG
ncbi:SulP family inorganic anion transporter [Adlercreutzia equolifaciens]|uniref:SulP family inorganic anion transporter n=2 Tax=Adlercreutzia equolifaciens TaxID=446660 RepID=UPI0027D2E8C5|nr:SulP family inorganic anion transporter [Adlercreutzia equolifaciens]